MKLAEDMLILHLPLIQSALGQKVEAEPVGLRRLYRERSQRWTAMANDEVASLPGETGLPLGQSRSQERASPLRAKFGLSTSLPTGRMAAYAVSGASKALVLQAIMSSTQHGQLTDEVPRRPVLGGRVSPGYKSDTKGLGYASVTGMGSPQPRLKGCQQRQSRTRWDRFADFVGIERQNLRVPRGPLGSMRQVSSAVAATIWPGGTSSCQPVDWLRNCPAQLKSVSVAVRLR